MAGEKALEEDDISLIILDVGLPDVNGFELFKKIRERINVPVIFLTARGEEIDHDAARALASQLEGFNDGNVAACATAGF